MIEKLTPLEWFCNGNIQDFTASLLDEEEEVDI